MSNTLNLGTDGNWATKKNSLLAYNSENENYKPLPFNFERDSIATRVNKEGLIEVVGNDIPRIDYTDSADGVLLLEPSRTNLITQSEAFDNSYWTKSGTSVVSGFSAPDGSNNAFKLVEDTSTNHQMFKVISGTGKVLSFYAKADGRDWVAVNCGSNTYFNVALGTVGTVASGSEAKIESLPNGWYRCSVTETSAAYGADISLSSNGTTTSYQGDGTSGVYIFGMQLEQGSYATSYIPTSGSTVQRASETANGSGNSEVFNDSEGVLFADISALDNDLTNRRITISDPSGQNFVMINYTTTTNQIAYSYYVSGVYEVYLTENISKITNNTKISVSWSLNKFQMYINGFLVKEQLSGNLMTGNNLDNLRFSLWNGNNPFYGKTKELGYYDAVLTDEELEYMTSYRSLNELVTELNLNTL